MYINEVYPTFVVEDEWGRKLRFSRDRERYYRQWLNPPASQPHELQRRAITRQSYANALLYAIEEEVNHTTGPYSGAKLGPIEKPGDVELDKFFGPRKRS